MLLVVCKCGTDSYIQPSALDNNDKWLPLARVPPVPTVCDTGVRKEQGVGGVCKEGREQVGYMGAEECEAFCCVQKPQRNGASIRC